MSNLHSITISNFRALQKIEFTVKGVNVIFGPNGVGKTTFLDALNFLRECLTSGPDRAAAERHHGIGLLTEGAENDANRILIGFQTPEASYEVSFGYSSGRIEAFVGEKLYSTGRQMTLIDRKAGSDQVAFFHEQMNQTITVKLPDPERLALNNFMLFSQPEVEAESVNSVLRSLHFYSSRSINLYQLRRLGSEASIHTYPFDRWQNLWSALRNLQGRQAVDNRYETIVRYMREAFPQSFKDLLIEPLGIERVGGSIIEPSRKTPIAASGVSDGHLQMLGLLTALFGDTRNRSSIILFDEPETSLHPHAIAVFARSVLEAADSWDRQVLIATHSPVLLSQFKPDDVVVASIKEDGSTSLTRVAEVEQLKSLLEDYSLGSLYMAEAVGAQGNPVSGTRAMRTQPIRFGLIVTGRGEVNALHELFNAAVSSLGFCVFEVVRRCEQLRPRTSGKSEPRKLRVTGSSKPAPTRDQELGLAALGYLRVDPSARYLLVIDDLEDDPPAPVFQRYRDALDGVLAKPGLADRAAVHFLVNMLEAYFFANAQAVNSVGGHAVLAADYSSDVETIPHPKNQLAGMWPEYRETDHGEQITKLLDLAHILSDPDQCCWLRAAVAWCMNRLDAEALYAPVNPSLFQLEKGCKANLTVTQKSGT